MGRRRNKQPKPGDIVGPLVGIILLLLFAAAGFNLKAVNELMRGLSSLLLLLAGLAIGGLVLFFVVRFLTRTNRAGTSSMSSPQDTALSVLRDFILPKNTGATPASVIEKLRATDWYQFEKVVGLVYECQGYQLSRRGGANPDGGVDLLIEKDGERAAVQCKRWKKWKVDVPKIRELIGAMTHERLPRGVIVTLNGFTLDAKQLAVEHNIDIVHDETLATMITGLTPTDQFKVHAMLDDSAKYCPKCESVMEWKTPPPGKSWKPFWGCPRYPRCRGTLEESA